MNGWKWKVPTGVWHQASMTGYPGWEIEEGESTPAFVKLEHVRKGGEVESRALALEWDDEALENFYQRDWTQDGLPFVENGDTYWSGWWFATPRERDRFLQWWEMEKEGGK